MLCRVTITRYETKHLRSITAAMVTLGLAQNVQQLPEGIRGDFVEHNREGCYLVMSRLSLLQVNYECEGHIQVR